MALDDRSKHYVESWFTPESIACEFAWVEKLNQVIPIYQEMGFTRGESAILFLLSQQLTQISYISGVLRRWDEDE